MPTREEMRQSLRLRIEAHRNAREPGHVGQIVHSAAEHLQFIKDRETARDAIVGVNSKS